MYKVEVKGILILLKNSKQIKIIYYKFTIINKHIISNILVYCDDVKGILVILVSFIIHACTQFWRKPCVRIDFSERTCVHKFLHGECDLWRFSGPWGCDVLRPATGSSRLLGVLKGRCLPHVVIWRCFFMQMRVAVHEQSSSERVGFISVHVAYTRVINNDLINEINVPGVNMETWEDDTEKQDKQARQMGSLFIQGWSQQHRKSIKQESKN